MLGHTVLLACTSMSEKARQALKQAEVTIQEQGNRVTLSCSGEIEPFPSVEGEDSDGEKEIKEVHILSRNLHLQRTGNAEEGYRLEVLHEEDN